MRKTKGSVLSTAAAIGIVEVAGVIGKSESTVRRLIEMDPEFPKPFRYAGRGDLMWEREPVVAYVRTSATRFRAA